MCLLKKCSIRLYMYQKFINFYIIWNLRAILIKQCRWRIWGPLSLNEVDVCTTLLSFYVWSHKINSDGLFWLADGPEPLKENDLRTATLIIEVFGEDLVSILIHYKNVGGKKGSVGRGGRGFMNLSVCKWTTMHNIIKIFFARTPGVLFLPMDMWAFIKLTLSPYFSITSKS